MPIATMMCDSVVNVLPQHNLECHYGGVTYVPLSGLFIGLKFTHGVKNSCACACAFGLCACFATKYFGNNPNKNGRKFRVTHT